VVRSLPFAFLLKGEMPMGPLDLVKLSALMRGTAGKRATAIGLIDGPVNASHPDFAGSNIQEIPGKLRGTCSRTSSIACMHGTFVAGILSARRGSVAPAICPECTLLVRPIFAEDAAGNGDMPSATPAELAAAIVETVDAGVRVINLSAALLQRSGNGERELARALDFAAARGVIIVAAAGNQGTVGGSAITRHPWVIPVAGCDGSGRPISESNFGSSIGRRGLSAPAQDISSLGTNGEPRSFHGTSAAAPFVTGTIALLFSEFSSATGAEVKLALLQTMARRNTVVPPLLDAAAAYVRIAGNRRSR
jgi:subtilisin family serine protease